MMTTTHKIGNHINGDRATADDAVLTFRAISKRFQSGRRRIDALRDISLDIRRGRITGLIGPDGAGKTTLMRLAAGLLRPDSGQGSVLGMDIVRQALSVQATVGYMPQRFGLYDDMTVQENLDLYADLQGVAKKVRPDRYRELMRITGLAPFTGRQAGRLSGGMKQKLGLACTLVHPPQLLLLDEPTVGVDPVSRRELWQIIDRFVREEETTVLLSTAYLDEAERCDEVIILHEGKLLGQGPPQAFSDPLAGRTYKVQVSGRKTRNLQEKLTNASGVADAVIQGDAVRLVLESTATAVLETLLPGVAGASMQPVAPRFEDGFVVMLRECLHKGRRSPGVAHRGSLDMDYVKKSDSPMIAVRDVQRRFGDFYAVKGVTFGVQRGEVFGLLGANGAGKTTTFRMLCGLLPASAGSLLVAGVDVRRTAAAARSHIGYMSQKFSLYGNLSVAQNLQFFSRAYGLKGRRRAARVKWAIEQFDLGLLVDATSATLSLGYKQRLALACALMHEPDILFLDEPTSGVDPLARREFWHRINALAAQNVTVLVTTHFMEEAEYCDRLAIMVAGEILALGAPPEIKRQARSENIPEPTMEDAFIHVLQAQENENNHDNKSA
jgi:ABC-2 type transport system ATP-binding protein